MEFKMHCTLSRGYFFFKFFSSFVLRNLKNRYFFSFVSLFHVQIFYIVFIDTSVVKREKKQVL